MVVHCAALVDVDRCEREPSAARTYNVEMTEKLVRFAHTVGARFVHISTDAVFDGEKGQYTETDDPNPINVYGRTKLTAENVVQESHANAVVIRTNIYGWNATAGRSLAEWMLGKLRAGEELPAFADAYFSPIYVGSLADCLLELASTNITGVVHVSGRERCSKLEFAECLAEVFDLPAQYIVPTSVDDIDFDAPRGRDLSLSVQRAACRLDCTLPTVREGLELMRRDERA